MNIVYAMKLWWMFLKQGKLWTTFMWRKYIGAMHPSKVQEKIQNFPHWKRILEGRKETKRHIFWILGKGKISLWLDKWLGKNTK